MGDYIDDEGEEDSVEKGITADETIDESIINIVHNYPCIYDKKLRDYKNEDIKYSAWLAIAANLNHDVEYCMNRWRTLCTKFRKERKILELEKRKGAIIEKKRYRFGSYAKMLFMDQHIQKRTYHRPLPSHDSDPNDETYTPSRPPAIPMETRTRPTTTYTVIAPKRPPNAPAFQVQPILQAVPAHIQQSPGQLDQVESELLRVISNKLNRANEFNSYDHFGSFVAAELKKMPDALARRKIQEITTLLWSS